MLDFLFQYGLFAAKVITFFAAMVLAITGIANVVHNKEKHPKNVEVENINDYIDDLKDSIEAEIYSKAEFKAIQKKKKRKEKAEKLENKRNAKKLKHEEEELKKRLYVIRFEGDVEASESFSLKELVTATLTVANEHDEVLVIVDSAGGLVHNYGFAASQLARFKSKPLNLTVAVDMVAASGGYMMACVADKIIAAPFAVLGSIGVLAQVPNINKLLNKNDIEIELHTAGDYKRTLTTLGKNTNKDREKFKEELEEVHTLFKSHVKNYRPKLDIEEVATGEAWYGPDALDKKLCDLLMTSDDYIVSKKDDHDIYELSMHSHEGFKEKISSLLHKNLRYGITKLHRYTKSILALRV